MLLIAFSSTKSATHFKSEIVKIYIYPMTSDKVLQW